MQRVRVVFSSAVILLALLTLQPVEARAQRWLDFRSALGHEWLGGSFAAPNGPLEGDTRAEWSVGLLAPVTPTARFGVAGGFSRVTYDLENSFRGHRSGEDPSTVKHLELEPPPYERWHHVRWHVLLEAQASVNAWLDVYVQYRRVFGRLRSQTQLYWSPTDEPDHTTPYDEWETKSKELAVGVRSDLAGRLPFAIDLMFRRGDISPRNGAGFDFSLHGLRSWPDGSARGLQIGAHWLP